MTVGPVAATAVLGANLGRGARLLDTAGGRPRLTSPSTET
jgi:hypothetical protein